MLVLEVAPKELDGYYVPGGYQAPTKQEEGSSDESVSTKPKDQTDEADDAQMEEGSDESDEEEGNGGEFQDDTQQEDNGTDDAQQEDAGSDSKQEGADDYDYGYDTDVAASPKHEDKENAYDKEIEDEGVQGG